MPASTSAASRPAGPARAARRAAAERFRPERVKLLLIAEAPPSATERYFYFPEVTTQDSLFRYVVRLTLGVEPTREGKVALLAKLRDAGIFLIDVCLDPVAASDLSPCIPDLVKRASALEPAHVILIKATVYRAAYHPLADAGLPVVDVMIPFPGSGQQLRFEAAMRDALRKIGWRPPPR